MIHARYFTAITLLTLALAPRSLAHAEAAPAEADKNPANPGPVGNSDNPDDEEKPIDFEPIPEGDDHSKPPTSSDWQTATRVRMTRRGPRAESCRAWRKDNWIKIHCSVQTTAASLVGGGFRGVSFWIPEPKEGVPAPESSQVIFPIRPGDRRIFELFSFGETYGGSMISPGLILQEYWIAGDSAPTIILR